MMMIVGIVQIIKYPPKINVNIITVGLAVGTTIKPSKYPIK